MASPCAGPRQAGGLVGAVIFFTAGALLSARADLPPAPSEVRAELRQLVAADVQKAATNAAIPPPVTKPAVATTPQSEGDVVQMDAYVVKEVRPTRTTLLPNETPLYHLLRTGSIWIQRGPFVTKSLTLALVPVEADGFVAPGKRNTGQVELTYRIAW